MFEFDFVGYTFRKGVDNDEFSFINRKLNKGCRIITD